MSKSKSKSAIENSMVGLISQIISVIFQFINRSIFINYLGVTLLGLSSTLSSVLSMLSLAELGFQSAIVYSLYRPLNENDKIKINNILNVFRIVYKSIGIFFIIGSIFCLPFLGYILTGLSIDLNIYLYFILQAIGSACTYFLAYRRTLLYADQKEYISKIVDTLSLSFFGTLKIIFVIKFKNYTIYLILQLLQTYLSNIVIHLITKRKYPYLHKTALDKNILKEIWFNVKNVFVGKIAGYIHGSTDSLVISTFISTTMVGYLANYTTITVNIKNLLQSVLNPIAPFIGNILASNENENKENIFLTYTHIRYILSMITLIPTLVLMNNFIIFWVGKDFILSDEILYLLIADLYIHLVHSALCDFINGQGLFKQNKYVEAVGAIINIVLSVVLVKKIGISGVLIGTVISQIFFWVLRSIIVYKYCFRGGKNIYKYWSKNILYIFTFIFTYIICKIVYRYIYIKSFILKFLISGIILEIIIIMVLILIYSKTKEQKNIYGIIKRKLNK